MASHTSRRKFLVATGVTGATLLAGCTGGGGNGGDGNDSGNESNGGGGSGSISWHAGGTSGTYYPLSNDFKTIIEENTDLSVNVQSTGASVENVGSLSQEDADFALIQNDVASFAYNGTGIDAFEDNAIDTIRGVATLYPETIHIVTLADAGIESPADLEGATINTGDTGSGTQVDALQILEALGIEEFDEQNTGFSQAAEQLSNGDIDAAFVVGGYPVGAIEELAQTEDVVILPLEGEDRQAVLDAEDFFAEDEVPEGTYGLDEAAPTVAVQAMIATHEGVSEDVVEQVLTSIFDNTDQINSKQEFITVESAQDGMSIPLHPGAEAYFESAGGSGNETAGGNETENETEDATANETGNATNESSE
ncbi:TAXI family TRAP transporter solute-binding subunit [Halomarina ordinaria]|uniref:TAXI family TRAP transporter solute-binding subunit n=1 Tax=Halomarina ordinaria TaxID=3033939 RepID=A0ABD5UEY7_9EURY|nr:TAXI family TRAP transporter solute-binding subunit [Halomarina sp. PSRA2]